MSDERQEERTTGRRAEEVDVVPLREDRSRWTWILLLQGPVLWALHFLTVYLLVEAWCSPASPGPETWLGTSASVAATIVATVVAVVLIAVGAAVTAHRHRQARAETRRDHEGATDIDQQLVRDQQLLLVGLLLAVLSVVAVLVVGLPALWVPTC